MASPSAAWEFRLRALLDAPIHEIEEVNLETLVADGVREDVDLDFKQSHYGSSDSEKRELASDIAAMANERGGLIIIGIRDEEDAAKELTPVDLVDGLEARYRQVVASNAAPNVAFDVHVVVAADEEKKGYYLLAVPPSSLRPHAVRKNNDLRYPRRNGTTTRWLNESEVADMYRDRFRLGTDQSARAETILRQGLAELDLEDDGAYLAIALVPQVEGFMSISQARIKQIEEWSVDEPGSYCWRGFFGGRPRARSGLRRIVVAYGLDNHERAKMPYAELYSDVA